MRYAIDIETLDVRDSACILSIGAVGIDDPTRSFYIEIDWEKQLVAGRSLSPSTLKWWLRQSREAQACFHGKIELRAALEDLKMFLADAAEVWAYGNMDGTIIESAYRQVTGIEDPHAVSVVGFRKWRDGRTLRAIFPEIEMTPTGGVSHNALDDAKWLADFVNACLPKLAF